MSRESILEFERGAAKVPQIFESALSCTNCSNKWDRVFHIPKVLPNCGHSLCMVCIMELFDINRSSFDCPECGTGIKIGAKDRPDSFKTNFELMKMMELIKTVQEPANARQKSQDLQHFMIKEEPCMHTLLTKSPLSCPHCSMKFCSSCEAVHCQRLRDDILVVAKRFPQRMEQCKEGAEEKEQVAKMYVSQQAEVKTLQALADLERIRAGLNKFLDERQLRTIEGIEAVKAAKMAEIDDIVRNAKLASLPVDGLEFAFAPLHSFDLSELAGIHDQAMLAEKRMKALETLEDDVKNGVLTYKMDYEEFSKQMEHIGSILSVQPYISWQTNEEIEVGKVSHILEPFNAAVDLGQLDILLQFLSSEQWSEKAIRLLAENRAHCTKQTPLLIAANKGHFDVVKLLVEECKADLTAKDLDKGQTACHFAAYAGHFEIVQYLCEKLPELTKLGDKNNASIFHLAAGGGHLNICEYLLNLPNGREMLNSARSISHRTVLHYACIAGAADVVDFLLRNGASASSFDTKGRNALHHAVAYTKPDVVQILAHHDRNLIDQEDFSHKTPRDLSLASRDPLILKLMKR